MAPFRQQSKMRRSLWYRIHSCFLILLAWRCVSKFLPN